jgi:hypothetical protein
MQAPFIGKTVRALTNEELLQERRYWEWAIQLMKGIDLFKGERKTAEHYLKLCNKETRKRAI